MDSGTSVATPPGHDRVHHQAVSENLPGKSLPVLAQARELRQSERQGRVVAQGPQVTQVVGHTLAFEHQRAQPRRARRNLAMPGRFKRHAISPGISDGRIA